MNLKELISQYEPYNAQEEQDKKMILKYLDLFEDVLTRKNDIVHFTCSGFVLNKSRDKVLMVYHNIYHSWSWTGGHADGNDNFLEVAIKEVQEETGVQKVNVLSEKIASLDVLSVLGHIKKGKYVTSHIHISVAYLLEVEEGENLKIKEDENSNVGWLPLSSFLEEVKEEHMKPIYQKIIDKAVLDGYIKKTSTK